MPSAALLCTDVRDLQHNMTGVTTIKYALNAKDVTISFKDGTVFDTLYVYGSHGNFAKGAPTQMNGLGVTATQNLVKSLIDKKIKAKNIVLDFCFSSGFAPAFASILDTSGKVPSNIVCHWGSAPGIFVGSVKNGKPLSGPVGDQFDSLEEMSGGAEGFVSLALYAHDADPKKSILYRKKYKNLKASSEAYVELIAGQGVPADFSDLPNLDKWLLKNQVAKIIEFGSAELKKIFTTRLTGGA